MRPCNLSCPLTALCVPMVDSQGSNQGQNVCMVAAVCADGVQGICIPAETQHLQNQYHSALNQL